MDRKRKKKWQKPKIEEIDTNQLIYEYIGPTCLKAILVTRFYPECSGCTPSPKDLHS